MKCLLRLLSLILIITCLSQYRAFAQNSEIKGIVWEPKNNEALAFAQVALFPLESNIPLDGTLSDSLGLFSLKANLGSTYRIQVQFLGYEKYTAIIQTDSSLKHLGKIALLSSAQNLHEIVVTAEQKAIGNENGNWVLYPDKLAEGGTNSTVDLLSNLPSVSMDMDDKATIRGREATILIDGVKADDISELDQITPSSIAKIEVIQNPSAKYDAEGSVINITLKAPIQSKSFSKLKLGADHMGNHQENLYASKKYKNWGGFAQASHKENDFESSNQLKRENKIEGQVPVILQDKDQSQETRQKQIRLGINHRFSPIHLAKLMGQWQKTLSNPLVNTLKEKRDHRNELSQYTEQDQASEKNKTIRMLRAQYVGKWENQNLKFQFNYRQIDQKDDRLLESLNYSPQGEPVNIYPYQKRDDIALDQEKFQSSIDYELQASEETGLELGADASLDKYDQNSAQEVYNHGENKWLPVPAKTFLYTFEKQSAAIYGIINHQHNKWFTSVGTRLRYIARHTENSRNDIIADNNNSYLSLLPTIKVGHNWEKSDLSFSYKKSYKLPAAHQLNSYRNDNNPLNIQYGNPNLKPEKEHSISLEYSLHSEKYQMGLALYRRYIKDVVMAEYKSQGDTLFRTFGNLGEQSLYGLEYTFSYKATKWCRFNGSGTIYHQSFSGMALSLVQKQIWSYNYKLSSTFQLQKNTRLQVNYSWQSKTISKNGLQGKLYNLDLAINRHFFKKKLQISLKGANLLDSKKQYNMVENMQFSSRSTRYQNTRRIMFGVVYKWTSSRN